MSTVYGPTPDEAIQACYVARAAEEFLDAWIEHKIVARHVKELASALDDFHEIVHTFHIRAQELVDVSDDATATGIDGNNNRLAFEVPD